MRTIARILFALASTLVLLAPDAWGQAGRTPPRRSLPDANNGLSLGKPPAYERDADFWRQRYQEVLETLLPKFTPPNLGQNLTVVPRVGGPVTGELKALSDGIAIIGETTFRSPQLTPESCCLLFATDWAAAQAKEIVTRERATYEHEEDAKWQKTYAVKKQQAEALGTAMTSAKQDNHYKSAIATLEDAIAKNPEALNIVEARAFLGVLKEGDADAIATEKAKQQSAAVAAAALSSSENLALYFANKVASKWRTQNQNIGGQLEVQGRVRSADVFLGTDRGWVKFYVIVSHNGKPIMESNFDIRFVKDFGRWEFDKYTCDYEFTWADAYVRFLLRDMGL